MQFLQMEIQFSPLRTLYTHFCSHFRSVMRGDFQPCRNMHWSKNSDHPLPRATLFCVISHPPDHKKHNRHSLAESTTPAHADMADRPSKDAHTLCRKAKGVPEVASNTRVQMSQVGQSIFHLLREKSQVTSRRDTIFQKTNLPSFDACAA